MMSIYCHIVHVVSDTYQYNIVYPDENTDNGAGNGADDRADDRETRFDYGKHAAVT